MILYYSTATGDFYSSIDAATKDEHACAAKRAEQVDKLSRTLRRYNTAVDVLRKQYEREIADQLRDMLK